MMNGAGQLYVYKIARLSSWIRISFSGTTASHRSCYGKRQIFLLYSFSSIEYIRCDSIVLSVATPFHFSFLYEKSRTSYIAPVVAQRRSSSNEAMTVFSDLPF